MTDRNDDQRSSLSIDELIGAEGLAELVTLLMQPLTPKSAKKAGSCLTESLPASHRGTYGGKWIIKLANRLGEFGVKAGKRKLQQLMRFADKISLTQIEQFPKLNYCQFLALIDLQNSESRTKLLEEVAKRNLPVRTIRRRIREAKIDEGASVATKRSHVQSSEHSSRRARSPKTSPKESKQLVNPNAANACVATDAAVGIELYELFRLPHADSAIAADSCAVGSHQCDSDTASQTPTIVGDPWTLFAKSNQVLAADLLRSPYSHYYQALRTRDCAPRPTGPLARFSVHEENDGVKIRANTQGLSGELTVRFDLALR